jgi:hypothetical protein
MLHADLIFRHGGTDVVVASTDSSTPRIDAMLAAAAVAGGPGDLLIVRIKMVSGASGYIEFGTNLTLP